MVISPNPERNLSKKPYFAATAVLLLAIFSLVARLAYLQLNQGRHFAEISEHNRIRLQDIPPTRGMIYDRNGILLVDNQPSFDLSLIREDVEDMPFLLSNLETLLDLPAPVVKERLAKFRSSPPFVPITIKPDLTRRELARVETYKYENPGLFISTEPRRYYLFPELAVHIVGYTGLVTERQLATGRLKGVKLGDRVGQYGVEQAWQSVLAGRRGGRQVEVDATGRRLSVLQEIPAQPGNNIILTIDARLQRAAEEAMGDKAGSVVALDPQTGEVLAMVSRPSFDQTKFIRGITSKEWKALSGDPLHPLENRALSGQYPPGSTYKIVTAIAGLMENIITPETTFFCPGQYHFGGRDYRCWKKGGHGTISLHRALVESCDVYFYRLGQKLGVDRLAKYARALGLGSVTGVGLHPERPGLVPTSKWKKKRFGVPWQDGETLSVSIGQGFNLVTPLQAANLIATVANGGHLLQPQLVLRIEKADGTIVSDFKPKVRPNLKLRPDVIRRVKKALSGVVNEERGTGRRARIENIKVGGKTGTAQVITLEKFKGVKKIEDIPYKYRDHAWFVAFAPVDDPKIAVSVVAEHSGHGGSQAAPVARQVIESFFELRGKDSPRLVSRPAPEG